MQPTVQAHISQQEAKAAEAKAIDTLLENSQTIQIPLNPKALKPSLPARLLSNLFPGLKNKHLPGDWDITIQRDDKGRQTYLRTMQISPLYLGTIDQIRQLSLQINYDEQDLQQDPIAESRRLFNHIDTVTAIAALATLNAPPKTTKSHKKQLNELKEFYKEHLTPSSLLRLIHLINFMSNPADFLCSIRLVQMIGSTRPKANPVE